MHELSIAYAVVSTVREALTFAWDVATKIDLAEPVGFDEDAFRASVADVHAMAPIVRTSARTGEGVDELFERLVALLDEPLP